MKSLDGLVFAPMETTPLSGVRRRSATRARVYNPIGDMAGSTATRSSEAIFPRGMSMVSWFQGLTYYGF